MLVCSFLSSGVALVIDITWNPIWPELISVLRASSIPYVHVDVSIRPFVRSFFRFIETIDTHDIAMIFQNEKGRRKIVYFKKVQRKLNFDLYTLLEQFEGIYEVLDQFSIRSITFDGLDEATADRIIKMRPMPANFIIFAHPSKMTVLFENVFGFILCIELAIALITFKIFNCSP